jgi:hypothetical protein
MGAAPPDAKGRFGAIVQGIARAESAPRRSPTAERRQTAGTAALAPAGPARAGP